MPLVLDASIMVSLAFPDENPAYAKSLTAAVSSEQAFVPALFWFELRDALILGERRGRVQPKQIAEFLEDVRILEIQVDQEPDEASVFALARTHRLTFYDAAYLEVAMRRRLPLATNDGELINAAPRVGVVRWTP